MKNYKYYCGDKLLRRGKRFTALAGVVYLLQACSHPLEIVGEGDIVDMNESGRGCTLEQFEIGDKACTENLVLGAYDVNYAALPRTGWQFVEWQGPCNLNLSEGDECVLVVSPEVVRSFWGQTMPATTAVFEVDSTWDNGVWDLMLWQDSSQSPD